MGCFAFAATVLLLHSAQVAVSGTARVLAEVQPSSPLVAAAGDENSLIAALEKGESNVIVTNHLDLTAQPITIVVGPNTSSVVGNCTQKPSQEILKSLPGGPVDLAPGQCLLVLGGARFTVEPSQLWLHNLYLRYTEISNVARNGGNGEKALLTLSGGSTWGEQLTFQGEGTSAVQGVNVKAKEGPRIADPPSAYFSGVDFLDLGHGPAALEMRCVAVTLDNSTFASVTAANESAVVYADADDTCLTQCRLTDSVKFTNNEASIVLRIAGRRATFFTDLGDHSEVYSDNVGQLVPSVFPLADSEVSQMAFIDSQTPWVVAKREELGYGSSTPVSGDNEAQESAPQPLVDLSPGASPSSSNTRRITIIAAVLCCALLALIGLAVFVAYRRTKCSKVGSKTAGSRKSDTMSGRTGTVANSHRSDVPPPPSQSIHQTETTEEEYVCSEIHLTRGRTNTATGSVIPSYATMDSSVTGTPTLSTVTTNIATETSVHAQPTGHQEDRAPRSLSSSAAPTTVEAEASYLHRAASPATTQPALAEAGRQVSLNDMWSKLSPIAPQAMLPAQSGRSPPPPHSRGSGGEGSIQRPALSGSSSAALSEASSTTRRPAAAPGATTITTADVALRTRATSATPAALNSMTQTAEQTAGTRVPGEPNTLSKSGSGSTGTEVDAAISVQKRSRKRPTSRSKHRKSSSRTNSSRALDYYGTTFGLRTLDRGSSVQSRGGREAVPLPELQEPQSEPDEEDAATVTDVVKALLDAQKKRRKTGGSEISIGPLKVVLVGQPVVKGGMVVQPATVVKAEGSNQPARNALGLSGHSEVSMSRHRSTCVEVRDSVELQVFVGVAAFASDRMLRQSPVGRFMRAELAVSDCSATATYDVTPPSSGAGLEREMSEQSQGQVRGLFDYPVSAVPRADCDIAGVLSGAQKQGWSLLVILEEMSKRFTELHDEVMRVHLNFHPAHMVCSRRTWYIEGFQCSASIGATLPVEWLRRRRAICCAPLLYSAPELVCAEHNEQPLTATAALDCWAIGVTLFQLFFQKEAAEALPVSDDEVLEMALNNKKYPWEVFQEDNATLEEFQTLTLSLLHRDPQQRRNAEYANLQLKKNTAI